MYPLAACRITIRFNWCLGCCGKCKIMRIANFYLRIFSCSELTQFEKASDKWSTSILVGHHKRSAEKGGMGSIYNWTALGLILFPPKWLHFGNNVQLWKQLQFAYTHTHTQKIAAGKQHDFREVAEGGECIFCFCDLFFFPFVCFPCQESNWTMNSVLWISLGV